ncbi:bacteriohemerythrin [Clostridium thermobutyricum]|uniref:Hemerythrin-like metal-binding domain-containing protein n=1 Tax=Clostridium thermobutyricum TaxID=29372 RepID=N9XZB1_9CLOT|nr:hemerythrin family protein [Clostridium thermobutyricum]ENZ01224.1 hemerythrin-like metal-binding domain-containing protein [Clostridium thermobutyricum]
MNNELDKYMLGQELIDEDHKELFKLVYKSYNIILDKFSLDKYDKIVDVIEELRDYTIYHFNREEELMLEMKYNKFFSHKVQHIEFIKKLEDINLNDIDKDQENYIKGLLDFVLDWIQNHILYMDSQFVDFYNNKIKKS